MHLPSGTVIDGRFTVVSPIGAGGMGVVVRARQIGLDRDVALKFLRSDLAPDKSDLARFEQEAHILSGLHHKNIVSIYGFGKWHDMYFMALEYLPGKSLQDFLRSGEPLEPEFALHIFKQICAGLTAAHAQGIVHRDLKPSNVLITESGTIKLIDFGFSRLLPSPTQMEQHLTSPGTTVGTVSYMPPEQCTGEAADERSDVYSAGAMLYHMLTGEVGLDADTPVAIMYRHVNESFPQLDPHDQRIADFAQIVDLATQTDPAARYQSAAELGAAASALTARIGAWSAQTSGAQRASLQRHKKKRAITIPDNIIVAALAVPILTAMFFLIQSRAPDAPHQQAQASMRPVDTFIRWRAVADAQAERYKWSEARAAYQHCLDLRTSLNDSEIATIYYALASTYYGAGDFESGDNVFKKASVDENLGHDARLSITCHYATALARRGQYSEAYKIIEALPFSRVSRWAIRNDDYGALAGMFDRMNQHDKALDVCDMTLMYSKMNTLDYVRTRRAELLLRDAKYKDAITMIKEVEPIHTTALADAVLAIAYKNLGETKDAATSRAEAENLIANPPKVENKLVAVTRKNDDIVARALLDGSSVP